MTSGNDGRQGVISACALGKDVSHVIQGNAATGIATPFNK
jgi:hypothetical protein